MEENVIEDEVSDPCPDCVTKNQEIDELNMEHYRRMEKAHDWYTNEEARQKDSFLARIKEQQGRIDGLEQQIQSLKRENDELKRKKEELQTKNNEVDVAKSGTSVVAQAMTAIVGKNNWIKN